MDVDSNPIIDLENSLIEDAKKNTNIKDLNKLIYF